MILAGSSIVGADGSLTYTKEDPDAPDRRIEVVTVMPSKTFPGAPFAVDIRTYRATPRSTKAGPGSPAAIRAEGTTVRLSPAEAIRFGQSLIDAGLFALTEQRTRT